ncbi:unnamed protein product [Plutella xylostella]|uniref:(diamondback moth) hypothetical protein n=1 Tax=Plutella xylostella TaxID=51655 RepID=A0A8S4GDG5_PLUXY|nr:unnamed protein product [Plutella xylostella]
MPIDRSPPRQALVGGAGVRPAAITNADSEPNLATESDSGSSNKYGRNKRKRTGSQSDEFDSFVAEMKTMFHGWKIQQNTQIESLQLSINEIKDQNNCIQEAINFMSTKYEEIKDRMHKLEQEKKENYEYTRTLEMKIESLERSSKVSTLEIRNLPMAKTECPDSVTDLVIMTGKALNVF